MGRRAAWRFLAMTFLAGSSLSSTQSAAAHEAVKPVIEVSSVPPISTPSPDKILSPVQDPSGSSLKDAGRPRTPKLPAADLITQTNQATFSTAALRSAEQSPMVLKLQVMLSRVHVSPGVIDGYWGDNVAKAVSAFKDMRGLPANGVVDAQVWAALENADPAPPLVPYVIQPQDAAGPFVPDMPKDYAEAAKLSSLSYRDPVEQLAEKFHMDEDVLRQLNPEASFTEVGRTIIVADIGKPASTKVARLVADKVKRQLRGYDALGALVVSYPATIGSSAMPSPSGIHTVKAVAVNPEYWYRPKVNFQQGNNTQALRLAPGPNNPVGAVWIGLDKPTYGIHGTPEPSKIDKTNSHGCVRLTNWDVKELVKLVGPGVPVEFPEPEIVTGSVR